jgi:GH15 family glucan-1,4-alpha-glucosidase
MPLALEDYALIGDLQTAALVGRDGSIDWLCLPDFSSPACFAALLGTPKNGRWQIAPTAAIKKTTRSYRDGTLVLDTVFETHSGAVRVTDFMPIRGDHPDIVRIVTGLRGKVQMSSELILRFDYGRSVPWVTGVKGGLRAIAGPYMVVLRTPVECHGEDLKTHSRFTVRKGQTVPFVLTYGSSHLPMPRAIRWQRALSYTENHWRKWIAKSRYQGSYKSEVDRSLITLKALTFQPTGGIIAAPTTSLPEKPHGSRNWDYRYCWLRDATFSLLAFINAGYIEEARAWRDWLLRALAGSSNQVQIMYGLRGERQLDEWELPWLPGYKHATPVRVGNAAFSQFQLDVFGEILDVIWQAYTLSHRDKHRTPSSRRRTSFELVANLLEHVEKVWQQPDQGIWEMRSAPRHYTYSRLMAWVAFDRGIRLAVKRRAFFLPIARWEKLRDRIHAEICRKGFNRRLNSFVQYYGSAQLDASLLFLPLVGFLPSNDPRIRGTLVALQKNLQRRGLLERYNTKAVDDDLPAGEGAFLACSFWLVQALKLDGSDDEARALFEKLLKLPNDVGLLAEEYDPKRRKQMGNFPQAFSHIALINAAFALEPVKADGARQFRYNGKHHSKTVRRY